MGEPKFFQIFNDNIDYVDMLSDEDAGKLFKAIFAKVNGLDEPDFSDNKPLNIVYLLLSRQIERDFEAYKTKCGKLRDNALKKKTKKAIATNCCQDKDKDKNKDKDKDEDKDKDNSKNGTAAESEPSQKYFDEILSDYNTICTSLPTAKKLTKQRRELILKAEKILKEYNFSFKEYFTLVQTSDFLTGKRGNWSGCNLDWLLKEDNLTKTAEGLYKNKPRQSHSVPQTGETRPRSYDIDELEKITIPPDF